MRPFISKLRRISTTAIGPPLRKKMTVIDVHRKYQQGQRLSMVTAYDYGSGLHANDAEIDIILVGDSAAMVQHGHDTTLPITMDEMLSHARAVSRGASKPLLIGDMPFGSYESSNETAINNAMRFLKEGGMDAIKLEGGKSMVDCVHFLTSRGISVMGHIGLTPQRISVLGGFRAQGKSSKTAISLLEEARLLQEAGAFAIVIECVPSLVAGAITASLRIPTIGIGAGPLTSGQVLVYHDLLGMLQHAHHAKVAPRFCKQYSNIGEQIQQALAKYKNEVEQGMFPSDQYCPYKMPVDEVNAFNEYLARHGITAKRPVNNEPTKSP